jgi:pyruvate/2-oxoglutarate dehydrogenase complex dihydrolipoamide acyltransferase (E2) component
VAVTISIPKLGVAMTEGSLVEWLVEDGATVAAGEPLYLLETDKVENEIEAPTSGVVRVMVAAGAVYPVGTKIAEIE